MSAMPIAGVRPVLLIVMLGLAGCGGAPRHDAVRAPHRRSPLRQAETTHEYPSRPGRRQIAAGVSPTAIAAVRAFASAYINWDAGSVAADMRRLARRSVGQARATTELAAAEVASDYELRRGGIANHGTVEAVAPLLGTRNRYVVVTRELTTATASTAYAGLEAAWHVAVATVAEPSPGAWVLSGWQPEN